MSQDPCIRFAKIDLATNTMSYKCPSCMDTHTHGAEGEIKYHKTHRASHCPKENFKNIIVIPI